MELQIMLRNKQTVDEHPLCGVVSAVCGVKKPKSYVRIELRSRLMCFLHTFWDTLALLTNKKHSTAPLIPCLPDSLASENANLLPDTCSFIHLLAQFPLCNHQVHIQEQGQKHKKRERGVFSHNGAFMCCWNNQKHKFPTGNIQVKPSILVC